MRLTQLGHSCVRLRKDDRTIVIDPGTLTPEEDALEGAEAVLITHEHFDHFAAERLRRALADDPRLGVYTCGAVAKDLEDLGGRVRAVGEGDSLTIAGFEVAVAGQRHEVVHPDVPPVENVGFLIDGEVFHPGDAFTVLNDVPTLLVPGQAPWMKAPEMIGYLRAVTPRRALAVHDGLLNDFGLGLLDNQLVGEGKRQRADFRRL